MKKIRFLRPKGSCQVGHVGDYPELDADRFVRDGIAEYVTPKRRPVKRGSVEPKE